MSESESKNANHRRCGPPGFIRRFWQRRRGKRISRLAAKLNLNEQQKISLEEIVNRLDQGRGLLFWHRRSILASLSGLLRDPEKDPGDGFGKILDEMRSQYEQLADSVTAFSRQLSGEQREALVRKLDHGSCGCGGISSRA